MSIFNENSEKVHLILISLIINQIKFFDMSKITKSNSVLKKNGVKNNHIAINQLITKLA